MPPTDGTRVSNAKAIRWREWSKDAFEDAKKGNKLVLLDLSAVWCHWCHVMDSTTYSDAEVIAIITDNLVPVRVDIDRRPDISERYNRGGFPTTAFLSDLGESVWGATYIPPADMKRIVKAILAAKASGEIDSALERGRLRYLDISQTLQKKRTADSEFIATLFEDIFSAYDVEHGGFGVAPKFPHPDVVNLLLQRYAHNLDSELAEAVTNTLDRMTEGLCDMVEGGVFRYSVARDWHEPHFEKMLETNAGFLRNLIHAFEIFGHEKYAATARGVANYLLNSLRDPIDGGFYGSQDADEDYYGLSAKERLERRSPAVDRSVFAGWNSEAVTALLEAGFVLRERRYVDAAMAAWHYAVRQLWNPQIGLVRHLEGQETYLFADQVSFFESLLAVLELSRDDQALEIAARLLEGAHKAFADPDGGYADVMRKEDEIGELASPRRPLVENSKWSVALASYAMASHDASQIETAWEILRSFTSKEVEAHGLFAAPYISAWWVLERGPIGVEVHDPKANDALESDLWLAAKNILNPGVIVVIAREDGVRRIPDGRPFAVVCTTSGCSGEIADRKDLVTRLSSIQSSQV
ncbi:MAG: DUF255 domain-containing protein [Euryarchaeota archaeon]|nr:DUF255 domain-containing protein [Euryarchaeota archaeon]